MSISVFAINTVNLILLCGSFTLLRKRMFCDEKTRMMNLCLYVILFLIIITIYTFNSFNNTTTQQVTNDENNTVEYLNENNSGSFFTIVIFALIVLFVCYCANVYGNEM